MPVENPSVRVWYDSQCPLCLREINLMRRLDSRGAIDFVDLYAARDCPVDRGELLRRFHAQEAGQPAVSGAAAFAAMWRAIPALRPLGTIARFPPVLWVLERAYRLFLRFRPRLQRLARRTLGPGSLDSSRRDQSLFARRLGMDIGVLVPADWAVEGVVQMNLDATEKYDEELTDERLFAWQAALFPPGRSGMDRINAGVWRDDSGGPMQVISGPVEREIQANELVPVLTFFYRKDHPSIWSS